VPVKLWVKPPVQRTEGGSVWVDIVYEGDVRLRDYQFNLKWDDSILEFVAYADGPFLTSTGRSATCFPPALASDSLNLHCDTSGTRPAPTGSGLLASVKFNALADGKSPVALTDVELYGESGQLLTFVAQDGSIIVAFPTPTPTFTPTDTATPTPTSTPTNTATPTPTDTPTATPTDTPTATATPTDSPTPSGAQISISPPSQTVGGGTASVDILAEDIADLGSYTFTVTWDDAILSYVSFSNGSLLGSTGRVVTCLPPVATSTSVALSCSTVGLQPGATGDGVLATINFSTVAEGDSPLDLSSVLILNTLSLDLNPQTTDGSITVAFPTPTSTATPTFTPTDTPTATPTNTPTPTATPVPTATATQTATPTNTPLPASATLGAQADTYIDESAGGNNYGNDPSMFVDGEELRPLRSLVAFDVSAVPANATVSDATLTLCVNSLAAGGDGRVHELRMITSAWTETGVTWDTQPSASASVTASATMASSPQCVTFDVTADVQAWVDGTANWGWLLSDRDTTPGNHEVHYSTRENSQASEQPSLEVTYTP
jgi:hypothetical protein